MLHMLGSKRKQPQNPQKTNFFFFLKQICQGLAAHLRVCAFVQPHDGEFCFLRLGYSGRRDFVLNLRHVPKGTELFSLQEIILTQKRGIRFCFLKLGSKA